jgi:hypothetical protein
VTKRTMQSSRRNGIPGRTLVRNGHGIPIRCAWDDCERNGYDEIKIVVKEPQKELHYIFCSERHKRYHIHGHHEYGKLNP